MLVAKRCGALVLAKTSFRIWKFWLHSYCVWKFEIGPGLWQRYLLDLIIIESGIWGYGRTPIKMISFTNTAKFMKNKPTKIFEIFGKLLITLSSSFLIKIWCFFSKKIVTNNLFIERQTLLKKKHFTEFIFCVQPLGLIYFNLNWNSAPLTFFLWTQYSHPVLSYTSIGIGSGPLHLKRVYRTPSYAVFFYTPWLNTFNECIFASNFISIWICFANISSRRVAN